MSIVLAVLTVLRCLTIVHILNRVEHELSANQYWNQVSHIDSEKKGLYIYAALVVIIFTISLVLLIKNTLKNTEKFKQDLLLFRPRWIEGSSLGLRRILAVVFNVIILIGFGTLFLVPLDFLTNFPGVRGDGFMGLFLQLYSFSIFWGLWVLLGLGYWIKSGFRPEMNGIS